MSRIASAAVIAALLLGCSSGLAPRTASRPAVLQAIDAYLRSADAELSSYVREEGHLGIYLAPTPAWSKERYVAELPAAAEAARMLLGKFPELSDVDICADGPWLPRNAKTPYSTALKVHLFRDRAGRLPARFTAPSEVLVAGLRDKSVDLYADPQIRVTKAWNDAAQALTTKRRFGRS